MPRRGKILLARHALAQAGARPIEARENKNSQATAPAFTKRDIMTGIKKFMLSAALATLAAFALGLTLFCATLILNMIALWVVNKYREKYD